MTRTLLLIAIAGCSSSGATAPTGNPALADSMIHPALGKLRVGHSQLADIQAQFATATISKDKSLGGTTKVSLNNAPAIRFETDKVSGYLTGTTPTLDSIDVVGEGLCTWVHANVGPVAKASHCQHHRKVIDTDHEAVICLADGAHEVRIECRQAGATDDLSYQYVP